MNLLLCVSLALLALALYLRGKSNCFVYALTKALRDGGEARIKKSPIKGALLRAAWTPDDGKTIYRYKDIKEIRRPAWRVAIRQIAFRGAVNVLHQSRVKSGDV